MAKDLEITMLFDIYGELLTEKQSLAMDLYYNQDLSLAEIAEPMGISRQGVRDFIKRSEKQLAEFEEKMGLLARFRRLREEISAVGRQVKRLHEYERSYVKSYQMSDGFAQVEQALDRIGEDL